MALTQYALLRKKERREDKRRIARITARRRVIAQAAEGHRPIKVDSPAPLVSHKTEQVSVRATSRPVRKGFFGRLRGLMGS